MLKKILIILTIINSNIIWGQIPEFLKYDKHVYYHMSYNAISDTLKEIFFNDQKYRLKLDETEKKFGRNSKEMAVLFEKISEIDNSNRIKVSYILDIYGWLGSNEIGELANSALFLIIQHSDLSTQEKYLPLMRSAVKNGKAHKASLAMLEDRIALRQGRKQIYGSQIGYNTNTKHHYVLPLEDPLNVDKRRGLIGLEPMAEYVKQFGIYWDPKNQED